MFQVSQLNYEQNKSGQWYNINSDIFQLKDTSAHFMFFHILFYVDYNTLL